MWHRILPIQYRFLWKLMLLDCGHWFLCIKYQECIKSVSKIYQECIKNLSRMESCDRSNTGWMYLLWKSLISIMIMAIGHHWLVSKWRKYYPGHRWKPIRGKVWNVIKGGMVQKFHVLRNSQIFTELKRQCLWWVDVPRFQWEGKNSGWKHVSKAEEGGGRNPRSSRTPIMPKGIGLLPSFRFRNTI